MIKASAEWFYGSPNGSHQDNWGYNNALDEAKRLLGSQHNDPNFVWVIYSDGPGDKGRGGNGVTCLPEDHLLGLVGKNPLRRINFVGLLASATNLATPSDYPTPPIRRSTPTRSCGQAFMASTRPDISD